MFRDPLTKDINESKGKRSVCAFCKVNICTRILCIFDIKFIASHDKVMNGGHKILHKVSIVQCTIDNSKI